jgi:hypothetical protein
LRHRHAQSGFRINGWHSLVLPLVITCVLISFVTLQTASVIEEHAHHHGGTNHHCCAACHSGPLFALLAADGANLAALEAVGWHTPTQQQTVKSGEIKGFRASRAPPA